MVDNPNWFQGINFVVFSTIAMYAFADKLACCLQQFMAGARKCNLSEISRDDLVAANRETEEVTGLEFMTDAGNEEAINILNS